MKKIIYLTASIAIFCHALYAMDNPITHSVKTSKATFAAGCFWGVEGAFRQIKGVVATRVGYAGGNFENPSYADVCSGRTGHAEAVEVEFDPAVVSYEGLLDVFWNMHDPTTPNRQGPDSGPQYRSAIFYHSPQQQAPAEASRNKLSGSGRFLSPIVTEIKPLGKFYPAEEYHQRYYQKHKIKVCAIGLPPKVSIYDPRTKSVGEVYKVIKTEAEWKKILTPEQFRVTRLKGTEEPELKICQIPEDNVLYECACCGTPLFESGNKYDSGTGWPSFWEPVSELNVRLLPDTSLGMNRVEVLCARCDAHLGHVFDDGPLPSGKRYCINSVALKIVDRNDKR